MKNKDWFVTNDGQCIEKTIINQWENESSLYRLYRFLTDLEDIVEQIENDQKRLEAICPLVRRLLMSSSWLQLTSLEPNPVTGWEVLTLYDEPFFPLTVQLVAWSPQMTSPIHNHACWGLVALLNGQEKNTFWRRSPTSEFPDKIEKREEIFLREGDILCLMPESIHQIEAISDEPTISFNLYGETNYDQRFEFDIKQGTAKNF